MLALLLRKTENSYKAKQTFNISKLTFIEWNKRENESIRL